ncbi:hypothetical protein [Nostoc sp. DSM 114161]|jgi:hypothetical protein
MSHQLVLSIAYVEAIAIDKLIRKNSKVIEFQENLAQIITLILIPEV